MQAHLIPVDSHERIRLIGHHHLCVGAFDELLKPLPDLVVETVYGYGFAK
jgi:hypothetical protein